MKNFVFFFCLVSLLPVVSLRALESHTVAVKSLLDKAREKKLSRHPFWLRLLHYNTGMFGTHSGVDGSQFFISKKGRKDPEAELEATLKAFFDPPSSSTSTEHPQCRYPARFSWLDEQLSFGPAVPRYQCDRFEEWKKKLAPDSVSLIFASYYLNNPASMYGHTFLRLNRKSLTADPLLGYTVNYAAATDTRNGIAFAVLGLAGGYRGVFSTLPYYMQVQKYNNLESRDLWEYELDMDPQSQERLLAHLWELGHTTIAYYFLNRNCSYQLLPLLDASNPDYNFSDGFHFRAIPLDTLRAVLNRRPGFVKEFHLRPSHVRMMLTRRAQLSEDEAALATDFVQRSGDALEPRLKNLPADRQILVLDTAYDFLKYKTGFKRDQPENVMNTERRLLVLRSGLSGASTAVNPAVGVSPPQTGHKTGRATFAFGATKHSAFEEASARAAIHDLEARQEGYVEGSQLEMFHVRLRYENKRPRAYLEDFTFIEIKSLSAWQPWVRSPSWRLKASVSVAHDKEGRPEDKPYSGFNGGTGVTLRTPFDRHGFVYALGEMDSGAGSVFEKGYRLGGGGSVGILLNPVPRWRSHVTASFIRYPSGDVGNVNRIKAVQSLVTSSNTEIRLIFDRLNAYQEGIFSFSLYY